MEIWFFDALLCIQTVSLQVRAKLPDFHAVIDRAVSSAGKLPSGVQQKSSFGKGSKIWRPSINRSRAIGGRDSISGSSVTSRRRSSAAAMGLEMSAGSPTTFRAINQTAEVTADLCLGDHQAQPATLLPIQ